ncbi:MAG TPA: SMC family ATPase [Anaerolineales bacterium]|nr:SMC family ATPase [Anaerolineales bacterium]
MIPIQLRIAGFLSYRDPVELDFTTFDLACISGQNGAGKSSLLDAMTWALFGQARKRDDSLVNLQSKAAEVALTFGYEDNIYRVQRTLPRGKTTVLEFQIQSGEGWKPLSERTLRDTQARIEQTLRLDYETFVNAAFFLQGRADQFTQQNAGKRKDVLSNILGLEVWETYKARAVEKRRSLEDEMIGIERSVADIDSELAEEEPRRQRLQELQDDLKRLSDARHTQEKALEDLRKAAASLDQQLVAEKAKLEEEQRGLKEQEQAVAGQQSALGELRAQIESANRSLVEAEAKLKHRTELEGNRNSAREEFATLKAENELLKVEMAELKEHIDQLAAAEGATCPLCGQALSAEHRQSTLKQLNEEGKEKGGRFRTNKLRLDELAGQIAERESQIARIEGAERERLQQSNAVAQLTERVETIEDSIKNWGTAGSKRLKEVEAMLASAEYSVDLQRPSVNLEQAERALRDLQEQVNRLNQEVGAARQKVSVLDELRKRRAELSSARQALAFQVGRHKALERAFGKDGVPALLIEQALPQIESRANELLDRLSDGQMSIRFVTQAGYKDKKRDDLRETLDIQISDAAGQRDYEMYSGGEAFRVNFAIRLALSEVLAQRKGARLQTLVIDEGFGSQDVQGRQRLIEAINLVRSDFAKILVITHLDELKDAFPTRIEVEKTDHGSTIQVI